MLRCVGRLRTHLQRNAGTARTQLTVASPEVVVEKSTDRTPVEACRWQQQTAAALGHQQIAPLHHVVLASIEHLDRADVIADALHRGTIGRLKIQLARCQLVGEVQPHHHAHALLHVGLWIVYPGFDEGLFIALRRIRRVGSPARTAGGIVRRPNHLQTQRLGALVAHADRRYDQFTTLARCQHHAKQGTYRHRTIGHLHLLIGALGA